MLKALYLYPLIKTGICTSLLKLKGGELLLAKFADEQLDSEYNERLYKISDFKVKRAKILFSQATGENLIRILNNHKRENSDTV